jgi:hypothetical protein
MQPRPSAVVALRKCGVRKPTRAGVEDLSALNERESLPLVSSRVAGSYEWGHPGRCESRRVPPGGYARSGHCSSREPTRADRSRLAPQDR